MDIINKVTVAKQSNYSQEEAKEILNKLVKFAKEHFKTEEDYMSKFQYPDYLLHYNEHLNFSIHMIIYNNQVIKGEYPIMGELFKYLQEWLINHIQETDRKYTDCFYKNGLK